MAAIMSAAERRGAKSVEATEQAELDWVEHCLAVGGAQVDFLNRCTPGYYNGEGMELTKAMSLGFGYGLGPAVFFKMMENWRGSGEFAGLEFDTGEGLSTG